MVVVALGPLLVVKPGWKQHDLSVVGRNQRCIHSPHETQGWWKRKQSSNRNCVWLQRHCVEACIVLVVKGHNSHVTRVIRGNCKAYDQEHDNKVFTQAS